MSSKTPNSGPVFAGRMISHSSSLSSPPRFASRSCGGERSAFAAYSPCANQRDRVNDGTTDPHFSRTPKLPTLLAEKHNNNTMPLAPRRCLPPLGPSFLQPRRYEPLFDATEGHSTNSRRSNIETAAKNETASSARATARICDARGETHPDLPFVSIEFASMKVERDQPIRTFVDRRHQINQQGSGDGDAIDRYDDELSSVGASPFSSNSDENDFVLATPKAVLMHRGRQVTGTTATSCSPERQGDRPQMLPLPHFERHIRRRHQQHQQAVREPPEFLAPVATAEHPAEGSAHARALKTPSPSPIVPVGEKQNNNAVHWTTAGAKTPLGKYVSWPSTTTAATSLEQSMSPTTSPPLRRADVCPPAPPPQKQQRFFPQPCNNTHGAAAFGLEWRRDQLTKRRRTSRSSDDCTTVENKAVS